MQHSRTGDLGGDHLGEVVFAHVHQKLVVHRSCGVDDAADRRAAGPDVIAQPGRHLVVVGDIDTGGGDVSAELFDRADRVDGREVRSSSLSADQRSLEAARSAQQGDVAGAAFGEVGGHDAAERSRSTRDDVGRIGGEFGGEGFGEVGHGRRRGTNVVSPRIAS